MKSDEIRGLLPSIIQRTAVDQSLLSGILGVMERLHERPEAVIEGYRGLLDPQNPESGAFLVFIAQWLDLDMLYKFTDVKIEDSSVPPPESQSREKWLLDRSRLSNLVANALTIYERRGTPEGILLALRLSTGYGDFVVEDATSAGPSALDPFHFKVYVNPAVSSLSLLVERIVTLFKPAHSTFELTYRSRTSVGEKS